VSRGVVMDEFNDSDISSLLNQIAGSSPDTMAAHQTVLGKVRRVRQRRVATVGAAAVVMVVSGAIAMVQNSQNRDGGSNIAVPLSPGDSQPVAVSTTIVPKFATTTIDGAISIDPGTTEPPSETPSNNPSTNSIVPDNPVGAETTTPSNTQAPTNSPSSSLTTSPTTQAPVNTPPSTQPPVKTPATTQPPVTAPPTTVPETKTWSCGGGSAKYLVTSGGLALVEITPAAGFAVSQSKAKSDEISVKFTSGTKNDKRKSVLKIKKSGLVSTSCEDENFDRDSDSSDSESNDNNDESADD
ncbi:MAG: hypothetical protein NWR75_07915, partial [Ilumatobacteraceae bacterium]|nr:hypothetical protein [Ilumatobacteraceae bacterium]